MKKRLISLALVLILVLSLVPTAFAAETAQWPSFRGNDANNGITHAETPRTSEEAKLNWAVKHSTGWSDAPSPMIIAEDCMIVMYGKSLKKLSLTDGSVIAEVEMAAATSWGSTPALYADGKIFCQLADSTVQAFDAKTLESLWVYHDELKGQAQSPITYSDGKIYVGLGYNSESPFVCLDAATGEKVWRATDPKGYYWAGAVVVGNYVVYGTDGGKLYSRNKLTGEVVTELQCSEDAKIRSTISYDNGKLYWMLNNATVCRADINAETGAVTNLTMKTVAQGQSTSTLAIHNGILYTAVGEYKAYKVMAINAQTLEPMWECKQPAYPQSSMLVCDAYADSGYLYLYLTYNSTPGGLYVIKAKTDGSVAESATLYTPEADAQNYCICSVIADGDGNLYYKNDSGYVFSIGLTEEAQNSNAAAAVSKKIAAIGTVTLASRTAIQDARAAYDRLSDTQKTLVTNSDVLAAAEASWEHLRSDATKNPVQIFVTVANKGSAVMMQQSVTVTDVNKNGIFDVDDALYAAHELGFEGGAAAGYSSYTSQYGLGIGTLWGDTSGSFGYWLNNSSCLSLEDTVKQGDHLVAFVYTDGTNWSDAYAKFDQFTCETVAGTALTVKLEKAGYDASWNTVFAAHAGASITVYDAQGKALTQGYTVKDNGDGSYAITIDAQGSYYIVATSADPITVPAVCAVTVEKAVDVPVVDDGNDVPPTGDPAHLVFGLLLFSVCGICAISKKKYL